MKTCFNLSNLLENSSLIYSCNQTTNYKNIYESSHKFLTFCSKHKKRLFCCKIRIFNAQDKISKVGDSFFTYIINFFLLLQKIARAFEVAVVYLPLKFAIMDCFEEYFNFSNFYKKTMKINYLNFRLQYNFFKPIQNCNSV